MIKDFKELYSKIKSIKGRDPLNISNLTFLKQGESLEDYINRIKEYLEWKHIKNNFYGHSTYRELNRLKNNGKQVANYQITPWISFIERVLQSPFYRNMKVGFIFKGRSLLGFGFYFKEVIIHNYKHKTNHKITDLYFYIDTQNYFKGFRTSFTPAEVTHNYTHSHRQRSSINEGNLGTGNFGWCFGNGPMTFINPSRLISGVHDVDNFLHILPKYLATESSEGVPYVHFSILYDSLGSGDASIKSPFPIIDKVLPYVEFKFNNNSIQTIISPSITNDEELIQYFGKNVDEFGNEEGVSNEYQRYSIDMIGASIHKEIKIAKPVFKKRLPSNFITQIKTYLENDVNKFSNKETIFTSFGSSGDSNSSPSLERVNDGNQVHEFQALQC